MTITWNEFKEMNKDEVWGIIKRRGLHKGDYAYTRTFYACSLADLKQQINDYLNKSDNSDYPLQYTGPGVYAITTPIEGGDESGTRAGRLVVDAAYIYEGTQ